MDRRTFLTAVGVGTTRLFGRIQLSNAQSADVVDVVEDIGVDDTGETAIDDDVEPFLRPGTRLEFPDGRYRIDQLVLYQLADFEMVATGDATLVPGDYPTDGDVWIGGGAVRNLRFEGFRLDTRDSGPTIGFGAYDGLLVRDIEKVGAHTTPRTAFGFEIWQPDGTGRVEGLRATDGDVFSGSVGATAVYTQTAGQLTFAECELAGWNDNGIYGSDATGPVHVEGGYFANNNVSQVRLSSPGSYVRGATIEVDAGSGPRTNMRGVRVADGPGPVLVEACTILMKRGQGNGGVVTADDGGQVTVRNSKLFVGDAYTSVGSNGDQTGFAIQVDRKADVVSNGRQVVEGTSITGGGHGGGAILFRRGNTVVRNTCIDQTGRRDGIIFAPDTTDNLVEDSTISVPNVPVVPRGASVETVNLSYVGTCDRPSAVTDDQYDPEATVTTTNPTSEARSTVSATDGPESATGTAETVTTTPGFGTATVVAAFLGAALTRRLRGD